MLRHVSRVIVLGGGLAGLTCAKVLAERGVAVELWEASGRFGGKAGSTQQADRWVDHGFHIFPAWYQNVNALLAELRVDLWSGMYFCEVFPRDNTTGDQLHGPQGKAVEYRTLSRTMVATLDMISRPDWYLDDLSVDGFLRGRLYAGRSSGDRLREISRKALGSPAYLTSALSMQRNLQWWMPVFRQANWNALCGPLQTEFIEPLVQATTDAGATLILDHPLVGIEMVDDRLVPIAAGADRTPVDEDVIVVSALPVEVLQKMAQDNPVALEKILRLDPKLGDLQYLDASPLAALDLHLTRRLDGLPKSHFILRDSTYDITGFDITDVWDEYTSQTGHPTVIQFCAGDTTAIRRLPHDAFVDRLIADVQRFFPFELTDVDRRYTTAMTHLDEPLFMNEVGSNSRRVSPTGTDVPNLYIIGDHTNTPVDLACMEGAVYSALMAAEAICTKLGIEAPHPRPLVGVSRTKVVMMKVARYPLGWASLPLRLNEPYYRRQAAERDAVSPNR
jgi:15-cis-phytoene desaturase